MCCGNDSCLSSGVCTPSLTWHAPPGVWHEAGVASGAWWNIGNACAIYGIIGLGYAVAYSLVQTALFVSGLLGIFVYREIRGAAIGVFFASGAVLTLGAVLLAVYA